MVASAFAERPTPKKSVMEARATAIAAPPPNACTMRAAISVSSDGASKPARLPAMNSASPATMTERRPKRSDSGATIRLPKAMATSDRLIRSCTVEALALKSTAIDGRAGSSTCMPKGPSAPMAAEPAISRRPSARLLMREYWTPSGNLAGSFG